MIRLVVFDFDGVIAKDLKKRNTLVYDMGLLDIISLYIDDFSGEKKRMYDKLIRDIGLSTISSLEPLPGVFDFIKHLKTFDARVGIFSMNSRDVIKEFLTNQSVIDYIDIIVGCEDVRRLKPYPEGLKNIMTHFSVAPEDTLYIGDSALDTIVGILSRVKTVHTIEEAIEYLSPYKNISEKAYDNAYPVQPL